MISEASMLLLQLSNGSWGDGLFHASVSEKKAEPFLLLSFRLEIGRVGDWQGWLCDVHAKKEDPVVRKWSEKGSWGDEPYVDETKEGGRLDWA